MKKQEPIIIAGPPRSGRKLIASLLIKHGVWIGKSKPTPYPQTNSLIGTENIDIKNILKRIKKGKGYKNWGVPLPDAMPFTTEKEINDFKNNVLSYVDTEDKWLVKTAWTVIYWELWNTAFPNAKWVLLSRDIEDGVRSVLRHPVMKKRGANTARNFFTALKHRQNIIYRTLQEKCHVVNVEDIIHDWRERIHFTNLMEFCGIDPDISIANDFIKPEMWNRGKNG